MCIGRTGEVEPIAACLDALDGLAATDVVGLDDEALRGQLLDLVTIGHRVRAELVRRVDAFDRRGLAEPDGFRTARRWLEAFGRLPSAAALRLVRAARLLRQLPQLAEAARSGEVPEESVQLVTRLADQVGADRVVEVEPTLASAARQLDVARFALVCDRVRAHLEPDGPDPAAAFERRGLTLSPVEGMLVLRGQLDAEGGAALVSALDALTAPPGEAESRTAAQRRADALVELARRPLAAGELPAVGGQRPQVGILLYPQALSPRTLARLAEAQRESFAGARLRRFLAESAPSTGPAPGEDLTQPGAAGVAGPPDWSRSGWADPPWLDWLGPISTEAAQRIACDADIFRIVIDPDSGMPLDIGRSHRLVPYWMRRALFARDRGCRWTGCTVPAAWTDAHHLDPWAEQGKTTVERCVLLCRYHHSRVHEGGWSVDLADTGQLIITRPGGEPYRVPPPHFREPPPGRPPPRGPRSVPPRSVPPRSVPPQSRQRRSGQPGSPSWNGPASWAG